jgi:hypothetical protein
VAARGADDPAKTRITRGALPADRAWAEGAITVAKQMTWRFIPREGVNHLSSDPLGGRIVRHPDAHQSPASVTQNDQAIEQLE